ncbi:MAG: hypothetical protein E6410_03390, partial [Bifidobacterium dentium]
RHSASSDPHAYERTAPPIIESEFLQSNNRGAVQIPAGALQIGFADQPKRAITELRFAKHNPLTSSS